MITVKKIDLEKFEQVLETACSLVEKNGFEGTSPLDFEKIVACCIKESAKFLKFYLDVELVSGTKFPDIVCMLKSKGRIGVEVKSTKSDKWECIGNSINESSRVDDISEIYVFFGKQGGVPKCRFDRYENVMKEIRITHFPRYFIDMDTSQSDNIFSKMDVDYNAFSSSDDKYKKLKAYYRKNLKEGEEVWWIDNETDSQSESTSSIIKLWNDADSGLKERILVEAYIYFTELFNMKSSSKYRRIASWLVAKHSLVSPSLRDSFSAGGKAEVYGFQFPRVVKNLVDNVQSAKEMILKLDRDDLAYYWRVDIEKLPKKDSDLADYWLTRVMNTLSQNIKADGMAALRTNLLSGE